MTVVIPIQISREKIFIFYRTRRRGEKAKTEGERGKRVGEADIIEKRTNTLKKELTMEQKISALDAHELNG